VRHRRDTRKVKVVVHKDQNWVNEVWAPLVVAAGLKRFALVKPESGLGKLTGEDVISLVDNRGLPMRGFESEFEAKIWVGEATHGLSG